MRTLAVALVALLCVAAFVAADEAERRPKKHHRKHHGSSSNLVGRRCDKGFVDVGSDQCCPKDHPTLIGGTCYADCPDGHDDMTLGSWVGCREMCEAGYQSSVNHCANGILNTPKKDTAREGVSPTGAKALTDVSAPTVAVCPKHHVAVKQAGRGKFKYGGCCPKDLPLLLAGKCYGACEEGKESITIGDFVGCRARCPDGFDEHTNDCTKSGEDDRERGDFPREHVRPVDRIIIATPKVEVDTTGCDSGWMRASKYYCCEQSHPVLIGLLCYDKCKSGYEDSGFGCRKACPEGWDSHTLTCGKGSVTTSREGYERAPSVSRLRKL